MRQADLYKGKVKTTVKIPKSRLEAPVDFDQAIYGHSVCGVKLRYMQFDFIQFESGRIVMFDAYSVAHKYGPFNAECGIVAFPFCCICMTDGGERVAYAGLKFGDDRAVKWRPLHSSNNVLQRLAFDPDAGSVAVPSGVCCFSDEAAYAKYRSAVNGEMHPLAGEIVLDGQTHDRVETLGKTYAVFSTGWGDGNYKCYAGESASGGITAVIADFGMIDYSNSADDELIDVEVDIGDGELYVYDPTKTEAQNHVARWTAVLESSTDPAERLRAYSRRGYAYHSANDTDRALADYMAAVECSKSVTDRVGLYRAWSVYDNAAEIFCARSDYESAIKLMNDALEVNDTFYAGAFVRLIDLYLLVKHEDKALETSLKMCEKRPDDPVAHMKHAECCVAVMDYATAAIEYGILADKFRLYENLFDEASCFIEMGDYEKAFEALERHPAKENYEQYWYFRALIDYKRHSLTTALNYAERSHGLDREYLPTLYLLIDIEALLNDYHAVARYAEEYKKLRPDNEYGYSICADAHMILGNFSECARNYCYLFDNIKADDKYAALAAVVCTKTGETKRSAAMLKKLKRKRSDYYYGAIYGMYITKYRDRFSELDRVVYKLNADADFLVMLSVFLLHTNNVVQATKLLDVFGNSDDMTYDVVAQQIRAAEKIGDKKHFTSFLNYYVNKFISQTPTAAERRSIAESFISIPQKHRDWADDF